MQDSGFEPKLVGFLCRWCTYQGADLAGTSRIAVSYTHLTLPTKA